MAAPKPVRKMRFNHFKVFSGNANPALSAEICYELGCQLAAVNVERCLQHGADELRAAFLTELVGDVAHPYCKVVACHGLRVSD